MSHDDDGKDMDLFTQENTFGTKRPPYSYCALIAMVIRSNRAGSMTLSEIFKYIANNFEYYQNDTKRLHNAKWQNLSRNDCFIKVPRGPNRKGIGNLWALHLKAGNMFKEGNLTRRMKCFGVDKVSCASCDPGDRPGVPLANLPNNQGPLNTQNPQYNMYQQPSQYVVPSINPVSAHNSTLQLTRSVR